MPDLIHPSAANGKFQRSSKALASRLSATRTKLLSCLSIYSSLVLVNAQHQIVREEINKEQAFSALPAVNLDGYKTDAEGLQKFEATKGVHFDSEEDEKHDGRFLYTEYTDPKTMSNLCKLSCIDAGKTFCTNSAFNGGRCCEANEACYRPIYCSTDNPKAPSEFKYLVCPNEAACGGKYIIPSYNGENLIRQVDKWTNTMLKNDVCSYIVRGPAEMQTYDTLHMKISAIKDAQVYVAEGKRYRWLTHLDRFKVPDGTEFATKGGFEFYVVGVATDIFPGTFKVRAWVTKGSPPSSTPTYEAPNLIKTETTTQEGTSTNTNTQTNSNTNSGSTSSSTSSNTNTQTNTNTNTNTGTTNTNTGGTTTTPQSKPENQPTNQNSKPYTPTDPNSGKTDSNTTPTNTQTNSGGSTNTNTQTNLNPSFNTGQPTNTASQPSKVDSNVSTADSSASTALIVVCTLFCLCCCGMIAGVTLVLTRKGGLASLLKADKGAVGETAGDPQDVEIDQMDANDLIHARRNKRKENDIDDSDYETNSMREKSNQNLVNIEVASGKSINIENTSNISAKMLDAMPAGMKAEASKQFSQDQMMQMFAMFQAMQNQQKAAGAAAAFSVTTAHPEVDHLDQKSFASMGRNRVAPDLGTIDPDPKNTQEFSLEDHNGMVPKSKMESVRNYETAMELKQDPVRHHRKNIGSISSERVDSKQSNLKAPAFVNKPIDPFDGLRDSPEPKQQLLPPVMGAAANQGNSMKTTIDAEKMNFGMTEMKPAIESTRKLLDDSGNKIQADMFDAPEDPQEQQQFHQQMSGTMNNMSEKPSDEASEVMRPKKKKKKKVKKYKDGSSANDSYLNESGMTPAPATFEDKKLEDEANFVKNQLAALEPLKEEDDSFPEFTMIGGGGGMPQEKKPEEKKKENMFGDDEFAFEGLQIDDGMDGF